ncbi:aminoglycoside phosphotransferase family protein [Legionella erythra]|uniref:Putative phosphotransferase n=1 Tax=Legionella erythra TaxID=448 RepID=A0A0W0TV47_LEGER|nr:phosphotransferase [Legionella erythra]KTC99358.1 putative phosphotransferase [Legionella erythra]
MQHRQNALNKWLQDVLHEQHYELAPLTGDASFRRYYRLRYNGISRIVMDAPPDKETMKPFLLVGHLLSQAGVKTPTVHACDEVQGFAVLDDFGDTLLLSQLTPERVGSLYHQALSSLIVMQQCATEQHGEKLPCFDQAFMRQELGLFSTWFLDSYLNMNLTPSEATMIEQTFDWLIAEISRQPQVFIHRDYHSRNIMLLESGELGIIDFQDAMSGPFTYDLVSLLKDCYIQWPSEQVREWVCYFHTHSTIAQQWPFQDFLRAFELCGLQRHLKVLGVFSRLYIRDNKPGYLKDLPLTLHYTLAFLESCEELQAFYQFMQSRIQLP